VHAFDVAGVVVHSGRNDGECGHGRDPLAVDGAHPDEQEGGHEAGNNEHHEEHH